MTATLSVSKDGASPVASVTLQGSNATSFLCGDVYLVTTSYSAMIADVNQLAPKTTVSLQQWTGKEADDVAQRGVHVLVLPCGIMGTIDSAIKTASLFLGEGDALFARNADFLTERGIYPSPIEPFGKLQHISASQIKSGDYLAVARFDGLDPLVMLGTGGRTGHSTVAVWEGSQLYVVESTDANPFGKVYWPPPYGIIRTPWEEWFPLAINASYHMNLLPLSRSLSAKFDEDKFWKWFSTVEGMGYGFENFLYAVLDTADPFQSFPAPVDNWGLTWVANFLDKIAPGPSSSTANGGGDVNAYRLLIEGMNHRLGSSCKDMACVHDILVTKDKTFTEVAAVPEQDDWRYSGGNFSMVCSVFAAHVWKVALGDALPEFQAVEQTPKDNYQMALFEPNFFNSTNCPIGLHESPHGTYCQLMGTYRMPLNDYNSIEVYPHINEKCASQWPKYTRCPAGDPAPCQC